MVIPFLPSWLPPCHGASRLTPGADAQVHRALRGSVPPDGVGHVRPSSRLREIHLEVSVCENVSRLVGLPQREVRVLLGEFREMPPDVSCCFADDFQVAENGVLFLLVREKADIVDFPQVSVDAFERLLDMFQVVPQVQRVAPSHSARARVSTSSLHRSGRAPGVSTSTSTPKENGPAGCGVCAGRDADAGHLFA
jgi:hypothetical protein